MHDRDVVAALETLVGSRISTRFDGGRCVELSLVSEDYPSTGLIRNHSEGEKREAMSLVCRLDGLESLNLRRNKLHEAPAELSRLTRLRTLTLGSNYLGSVPDSIRAMKSLEALHLGNNDLTALPAWLSELQGLRHLWLHKNLGLQDISVLGELPRLETLNLYLVPNDTVPPAIYRLKSLKSLSLFRVRTFEDRFADLSQLQYFTNCASFAMETLPECFLALQNLKMARLYHNSLRELPRDIGKLKKLEQLSFYCNKLRELPDSFAELQNLEKLNLGWNELKAVPTWLPKLPRLRWLAIFANPLEAQIPAFRSDVELLEKWPFSTPRPLPAVPKAA